MSRPATQRTADDLLTMLRRHYQPENRPAAGLFAPEIQSPDGSRRADLIWAPTTSTGGYGLVGHELKVSRSDLLVELADPAKCDPWAQFCEYWWLVVADPAMLDGVTIPHAWGVMAPPSGRRTRSMTIAKPAPKLHPVDPARAFRKLMAWNMYRSEAELAPLRGQLAQAREQLQRKDQADRELQVGRHGRSPHAVRVSRILTAVRQRAERARLWSLTDADIDEAVIAAAVDHLATIRAAELVRAHLERACNAIADAVTPASYVLGALETARNLAAEEAAADVA